MLCSIIMYRNDGALLPLFLNQEAVTLVLGVLQGRCWGARPPWWQALQMQLCLLQMDGFILKPL